MCGPFLDFLFSSTGVLWYASITLFCFIFVINFGGSINPLTQNHLENRKKSPCIIYSFALTACVCVHGDFCFHLLVFVYVFRMLPPIGVRAWYFPGQILFILRKMLSTFSWWEGIRQQLMFFSLKSLVVSNTRFQRYICMIWEKVSK